MPHAPSKPRKPLLHNFTSRKLIREPKLLQQRPIVDVASETVQHARYECIPRAYRTVQG
jgi:hypothetical protein